MKRPFSLILIYSLCAIAALSQQSSPPTPNAVVYVATALNHLTVLEFHEPVTMAAAGSSDFQIERESNKVFVKPVKSGAATDLFVWTASRRFAYELEITQEVKNMNFAIDNAPPAPAPPPKPAVEPETNQSADVVLTRALLGAEEIKHTRGAYQLRADDSPISLASLAHTQLDRAMLEGLGGTRELPLPVTHAEAEADDLHPGETTRGVVSIRQGLKSPAVVQLVFADGVKVTVVL